MERKAGMEVLVTICCRAGSKGLPHKNVKVLCGKPLVQWTIDAALEWEIQGEVPMAIVVTTDDSEVRRIAMKNNLFVIDRSPELCGDLVGKVAVVRDAWQRMEHRLGKVFDITLDLDVCNPLRRLEDIEAVYQRMVKDNPPTIFSVTRARRNPFFNMWPRTTEGILSLTRQDAPEMFDLNCCIYAYSRKFMLSDKERVIQHDSMTYLMPDWTAFDIDTQLDWEIVEFLMEKYAKELGQV